jgi:hypothetical protein
MSSSSYDSEDDCAEDLTVGLDSAINKTLLEGASDQSISIESALKAQKNKSTEELLAQTEDALAKIAAASPEDATDSFLRDFFAKRKWENKGAQTIKVEDHSDDMEEIDEGLEFEKRYNFRNEKKKSDDAESRPAFRHEEEGSSVIQTNPRRVEGEERVKESARKRKRREHKEEDRVHAEEYDRRLDEIDEKYRKLAEANGGKLTDEQLHEWVEESSTVILEDQGEAFPYVESAVDGGIEKAVKILDGPEEEEEEIEEKEEKKEKRERRFERNDRFERHRGRGRFMGRGRGGNMSKSRMDTYFAHRR